MSTGPIPENCAFVCASSCRKRAAATRSELMETLQRSGLDVADAPCLGLCDGLVAAVPVAGRVEIVSRLDRPRVRKRLVAALASGKRKKVAPHAGSKSARRKAIRKLSRKLAKAA